MKNPARLGVFFCLALVLPFSAIACPIGMQFNGNGCSPPYFYSGWDLMRDRRAAIDAIGSDRPRDFPGYSPEKFRELEAARKRLEKEKEEKNQVLAKGIWNVDSKPTPDGNLCAAVFSKYTPNEGGIVTILGFQNPKPDAWLVFHGAGLPKSKEVTKMTITLQQDNEPAQTLQVFNYRETRDVGTILFAVPGLTALLNGMSDKQRFKLTDNGKTLLDIEWHSAAPIINKLRQCAK